MVTCGYKSPGKSEWTYLEFSNLGFDFHPRAARDTNLPFPPLVFRIFNGKFRDLCFLLGTVAQLITGDLAMLNPLLVARTATHGSKDHKKWHRKHDIEKIFTTYNTINNLIHNLSTILSVRFDFSNAKQSKQNTIRASQDGCRSMKYDTCLSKARNSSNSHTILPKND